MSARIESARVNTREEKLSWPDNRIKKIREEVERGSKRIWSSVSRQSGTYLKVEDTLNGPGSVWAWDSSEFVAWSLIIERHGVTFQWMIDERRAILI